jgi:hypothetical protein
VVWRKSARGEGVKLRMCAQISRLRFYHSGMRINSYEFSVFAFTQNSSCCTNTDHEYLVCAASVLPQVVTCMIIDALHSRYCPFCFSSLVIPINVAWFAHADSPLFSDSEKKITILQSFLTKTSDSSSSACSLCQ